MKSVLIRHLSLLMLTAFLLVVAVGGGAWWQFGRVAESMAAQSAATVALQNVMAANGAHDRLRADVLTVLHAAENKDVTATETARKDMDEHANTLRELLAKAHKLNLDAKTTELLNAIRGHVESYIAQADGESAQAVKNHAAAETNLPVFAQTFELLEGKLDELSNAMQENLQTKQAQTDALVFQFRSVLGWFLLTSGGLLALLSAVVARWVLQPFPKNSQALSEVAAAAKSSAVVATTSREWVTATGQQTASLEAACASLEEMTAMTKRTADNAQAAKELASQIRAAAENGPKDIVAKARQLEELITAISQAANEQAQGLAQIHNAMSQMASVTEGSAESPAQMAGAPAENILPARRVTAPPPRAAAPTMTEPAPRTQITGVGFKDF